MPAAPQTMLQILQASGFVNTKLAEYVAVHDHIFKSQATAWSRLKTLLGFRIPFDKFAELTAQIAMDWERIADVTRQLCEKCDCEVDAAQREYLESLERYTRAVAAATKLLSDRQAALHQRSKGSQHSSLSLSRYLGIEGEYEQAIKRYVQLGNRLDQLFKLLR